MDENTSGKKTSNIFYIRVESKRRKWCSNGFSGDRDGMGFTVIVHFFSLKYFLKPGSLSSTSGDRYHSRHFYSIKCFL